MVASPLYPGIKRLLLFVAATTLILHHSTAIDDGSRNSSQPKDVCRDKCGNVSIPYPFGIGEGCFLEGFEVYCHPDNVATLDASGTTLLGIDIELGLAHVLSPIAWQCNYTTGINRYPKDESSSNFEVRPPFTISPTENVFTVIGCATVAFLRGQNRFNYSSACGSFCYDEGGLTNKANNSTESSSMMGCCQTTVPGNLGKVYLEFSSNVDNTLVQNFSPCSYAFIVDDAQFEFKPSYLESSNFLENYTDGVPLVLDWVFGNETCEEAVNKSSCACLDKNSVCNNYPINGRPAYYCSCSDGYEGNPYLKGGCQDINECEDPPSDNNPCNGKCKNTIGNYTCTCPIGTWSKDPKNAPCIPNYKMIIGFAISLMIFIIMFVSIVMAMCAKKKLAKEKERFFKQNGGHILYQQILSKQVDTVTIFPVEDLKKATDNFDKSRELGTGGHGTVYKGFLRDNKVVAVKRSKIIDVAQSDEFIQEIVILSQINHRNVVRLLGCCLEVEVPILVYEFIPNGTLFHLIHGNHDGPRLSLELRLRIAQESAEALAYLHLSTNNSIVHGDVKSLNILLDENYMAKVTDFGASRILPKDTVQLMTMVQGTLGYLDPEYLQERKLTEKSDVYSFGVVLLELITRKRAIYFEGPNEEGKSLASSFIQAMKENRVDSMLDTSIMGMGLEELFQEVVELASMCLRLKRGERPSMTQVADKLKAIRSTWREILLLKHEETRSLIERRGMDTVGDLSPSMSYTAHMLGLDIETPTTYHTVNASMG